MESVRAEETRHEELFLRFIDPHLRHDGLTRGNRTTLLVNGGRALPAMLEAIQNARYTIDLCIYIFRADSVGWRFANALAERARRGVSVRVLYDAVGCIDVGSKHFEHMRGAGVQVQAHNPLIPQNLGRLWRPNNRDHRKILTVDDAVAFVGGMNLADEYDGDAQDVHHWRDNAVRIEGPAAGLLGRMFRSNRREFWHLRRLHRGRKGWRFMRSVLQRAASSDIARATIPAPLAERDGQAVTWVHSSRPFDYHRSVFRAYNSLIQNARQRVWLMSGYFVPDHRLIHSLVAASLRGVDVRVIVPGISDIPIARLAGSRWYEYLTQRGVKVYELQGTILHGKAAVADGVACIVGSANLDNRSFHLNWEVLVTILDESLAGELTGQFEADMQRSRLLKLEELRKQSVWQKLAARLAYIWAPFW